MTAVAGLTMIARLLFVLGAVASGNVYATCAYSLNVVNTTEHNILVKDVQYKLHKSSWESLNFGAGLRLEPREKSYKDYGERKLGGWGFTVSNLAVSCKDTRFRFKFTYNCKNESSGVQTRHSQVFSGKQETNNTDASGILVHANIQGCDGTVLFGGSPDEARLPPDLK